MVRPRWWVGYRSEYACARHYRPSGDLVAVRAAAALVRTAGRPGWKRLKACPGPGCGWVFADRSRNGSRRWCQMSECGNRAKGAAFRQRARSAV